MGYIMDYEYIFSILADIATIFYCFFVVITILQVRKNRWLANKPILVCKTEKITIENDIDNKIPIYFGSDKKFELHLTNIGNGCAREICIKWKYDYKKMLSIIKDLGCEVNIFDNGRNVICGKIDLKVENGCPLLFEMDESYEKCDYIFQFEKENVNSHIGVEFPHFYLMLYTIIMSKNIKYQYNIPQIYCNITYNDIENKKYSKKYRFKFNYNAVKDGADIETIML